MKHFFTQVFSLIVVLWLGNPSVSSAQQPAASGGTAPSDTSKKAPPPPPAQLVTYPLSNITSKMTLSGYTQARFQYFTDTTVSNSFDVRRARLDLRGTPVKNLGYRIQIDFAPTTRVMDATLAYTFNPYIRITAGQQKIPFSLENIVSSYNMESVNRSQVVEALVSRSKDVISASGNNNGRDIGVWLNGALLTRSQDRNIIEYTVAVINGNGINKLDNNREKDFAGRLLVYPIKQLSLGGSYYNGSATYGVDLSTPKNRNRFGFEVFYNTPRITVKSEFIQGIDSATTKNGYYGQVAGFILPEKLQAMVKYDYYDKNIDKDDDASIVYSFGLNWYFGKYSKIQVEYDMNKEEATDAKKDNDLLSFMATFWF